MTCTYLIFDYLISNIDACGRSKDNKKLWNQYNW